MGQEEQEKGGQVRKDPLHHGEGQLSVGVRWVGVQGSQNHLQCRDVLPAAQVPHPRRVVTAASGQLPPIGAEGNAADGVRVPVVLLCVCGVEQACSYIQSWMWGREGKVGGSLGGGGPCMYVMSSAFMYTYAQENRNCVTRIRGGGGRGGHRVRGGKGGTGLGGGSGVRGGHSHLQRDGVFPAAKVPHPRRLVLAAGGQLPPVRAENDAGDLAVMLRGSRGEGRGRVGAEFAGGWGAVRKRAPCTSSVIYSYVLQWGAAKCFSPQCEEWGGA